MGNRQEADGGAAISSYIVQWSLASDFSITSPPHYGSGEVMVVGNNNNNFQYVIDNLTAGHTYYIRVAAVNSEGIGKYQEYEGTIGDGSKLSGVPLP